MIQLSHSMRAYCDAGFHPVPMDRTLSVGSMAEAKAAIKAAGYRVLANGKIVCPECRAAEREPRS